MDIRQLRYFIAIVEEGTISHAANRLHISQPPLSQQLKAMEEELGSILVYRRGKRLEITESGKALYKYALQMTQLMEEAKAEVQEVGNGDKGTLRLGINTLSSVELPAWLHEFRAKFPQVSYKIQQNESYQLCELVRNRALELAIVRLPLELDDFSVLHLHTEPFYLLASDQQTSLEQEMPLSQIVQYPLILPSTEGLGVYYTIQMAFSEQNLQPNVVAECSDISLLLRLVASDFGVAIVPETLVKRHLPDHIHAFRITGTPATASTALIWLKDYHISRMALNFIDLLTAAKARHM
ncbi:LysR family transcriptional regulator [Paenibacillus glucanolyticus]|uniref:LysR family transcriptional regulator n=1 Tax=Paenibacillus glucanolyticus TaxID=59843 RepID=A0A163F8A6_9BACL|nr:MULTISPECIES: LysR family transcriptional regulator [Paenibacillus]AWP26437.1 LysR family transcriptional regulator [Paenibacillus sp. Cedars]KZS44210.1 LysR family transcriptional regulator [Paenibacillus glucanolyticus]